MVFYTYVAVVLCLLVSSVVSEYCNNIFESGFCVDDVFYSDNCAILPRMYQHYVDLEQDLDTTNCHHDEYVPIRLIYKENDNSLSKQKIPFTNQNVLRLIIAVNISHNGYTEVPKLSAMQNLDTLDISWNHLVTATLYNEEELESLTSIDFSHNDVNNIDKNGIHPYEQLKYINLSYNHLVSIPDSAFDRLRELERLDISHNYIQALSPLTFEGCQHLLHLNMSHNRISHINSSMIRFNNLITLNLKGNKLHEIKSSDFATLSSLTSLDLSFNSLTSIDANAFDNMALLTTLDLSSNELQTISKQTFVNLFNLLEINLSANHFKVLPRGIFKGKTVWTFSIQENALTGALERGTLEGLQYVTQLDLGYQQLTSIEDFAFFGVENVHKILLNNNNILSLSKNCFRNLQRLHELDLSHNKITNIDFDKDDLISLQSLLLRNNLITYVKYEYLHNLNLLQFLDLSYNNISSLETDSFKSLKELITFEISNNPLSGALQENTFEGLSSLPSLDISHSMMTVICNNSFISMIQLRDLNMSYSKIIELQYNTFHKTGAIQTIDLSFNQLNVFNVNTSELVGLRILLLNGNRLTTVGKDTLSGLIRLDKLTLSYNNVLNVDSDAFKSQEDLRHLDVSFNPHLNFNVSVVSKNYKLNILYLQGITCVLNFTHAENIPISTLDLSYAKLKSTQNLNLQQLMHLDSLVLNHNNIAKLIVTSFANLKTLRNLDVSFNKISFIQPGTFIDNSLLHSLNISHNALTTLAYGIFSGLIYLHTLDMSYNEIDSLESERFYKVPSLSVLIADHNRINKINAEDFIGTSLSTLSIGENPITCELLVNLKNKNLPFAITAIRLEEKGNDENTDGVICNMNHDSNRSSFAVSGVTNESNKILADIRDILLKNKKNVESENSDTLRSNTESKHEKSVFAQLLNISNTIESFANKTNRLETSLVNITSQVLNENNITNSLLGKISKFLSTHWHTIYTPIKGNGSESLLPYIDGVKSDLENSIAEEKEKIMDEMNKKIAILNSQIDSMRTQDSPKHEKFVANEDQTQTESLFTKTCLALILSMLVCIILYKFYKSRMFIRNRLSISTRELPGAMEHSAL